MKRILPLLLAATLVMGLFAGCGNDTYESPVITNVDGETSSSETVTEEETKPEEEFVDVPPAEGMVRSKLTNEWISEELADARPIAVMMPTDAAAQPQYGIGNAEILYECMEEGGVSRQMAIINDWAGLERIGFAGSWGNYHDGFLSGNIGIENSRHGNFALCRTLLLAGSQKSKGH